MFKKLTYPSGPSCPNGVLKLHNDFEKAVKQALEISLKYIPKEDAYLKRITNKTLSLQGCLLVDFSEEQPQNALTGYFVFGGRNNIVHRFLSLTLEYHFFSPVIDCRQDKALNKGVNISEIENMIAAQKPVIFRYSPIISTLDSEQILFGTTAHTDIEARRIIPKDDVGMPFCSFKDVDELCLKDIPATFLEQEYTVVGTYHYAPYTTSEEAYCVLFAQLDNPYDDHAIKLLRWFPQPKSFGVSQKKCFWGDVFYEMGYVSRNENTELHNFMTENKSRILFGKKTGNKVALIGSVKMFSRENFNFPKCLSNIEIR